MSPTLLTSALKWSLLCPKLKQCQCTSVPLRPGCTDTTRGSKAVLDSAADCPTQEPKGEQANLQYLHTQGCHWVALLKAAESIILSIRHKCRYITDNCIQLLKLSSSPGPRRRQMLRQKREWQSNEMKQGNALLGKNKIIKQERINLFLHFQFLRKTAELSLPGKMLSLRYFWVT